jgi:L-amino acid N-acyltransferase YncA
VARWPVVRSFLLSLRMDGLLATIQRGWNRLFGKEEWYVFVRHLQPPPRPVEFPIESKGVTVREMLENDLDQLARLLPFEMDRRPLPERRARMQERLAGGVVATRRGRIVGAAWFADAVTPEQPWYQVVEHHIIPPARLTTQIFVVPSEKGTAWTLAKQANDRLAEQGVRTIVGLIATDNKPSMLVSRMLGGKMAARKTDRYWFGRRTTATEPVSEAEVFSPKKAMTS